MTTNKENVNYISNYYLASTLISVVSWIAFVACYSVNEFDRPFLVVFLPLTLLFGLAFRVHASFKVTDTKTAWGSGLAVGLTISSILMIVNYSFKEATELNYEVNSITNGRGNSMNMEIKTSTNENIIFNIQGVKGKERLTNTKLHLFKGIMGFYFGDLLPR